MPENIKIVITAASNGKFPFPFRNNVLINHSKKKSMQAIKEKIPVPKAIVPVATLYLFFFLNLNIRSSPVVVDIRKIIKKPTVTIYI